MQTSVASIIGSGKTTQAYHNILDGINDYTTPRLFVADVWSHYQRLYPDANPSISGRMFEYVLAEILKLEEITPFYPQAGIRYIPYAAYDFLLYDDKSPVVLSAKTSLRERWKQAAFEGLALREKYPLAETYLVTLNADEAVNIQTKITAREAPGLEACVHAKSLAFNKLIAELKKRQFMEALPVSPITTTLVCE